MQRTQRGPMILLDAGLDSEDPKCFARTMTDVEGDLFNRYQHCSPTRLRSHSSFLFDVSDDDSDGYSSGGKVTFLEWLTNSYEDILESLFDTPWVKDLSDQIFLTSEEQIQVPVTLWLALVLLGLSLWLALPFLVIAGVWYLALCSKAPAGFALRALVFCMGHLIVLLLYGQIVLVLVRVDTWHVATQESGMSELSTLEGFFPLVATFCLGLTVGEHLRRKCIHSAVLKYLRQTLFAGDRHDRLRTKQDVEDADTIRQFLTNIQTLGLVEPPLGQDILRGMMMEDKDRRVLRPSRLFLHAVGAMRGDSVRPLGVAAGLLALLQALLPIVFRVCKGTQGLMHDPLKVCVQCTYCVLSFLTLRQLLMNMVGMSERIYEAKRKALVILLCAGTTRSRTLLRNWHRREIRDKIPKLHEDDEAEFSRVLEPLIGLLREKLPLSYDTGVDIELDVLSTRRFVILRALTCAEIQVEGDTIQSALFAAVILLATSLVGFSSILCHTTKPTAGVLVCALDALLFAVAAVLLLNTLTAVNRVLDEDTQLVLVAWRERTERLRRECQASDPFHSPDYARKCFIIGCHTSMHEALGVVLDGIKASRGLLRFCGIPVTYQLRNRLFAAMISGAICTMWGFLKHHKEFKDKIAQIREHI